MRHYTVPHVGHWYQDREYHSAFNVVALDDSGQNVEIQYFAGEIDGWTGGGGRQLNPLQTRPGRGR